MRPSSRDASAIASRRAQEAQAEYLVSEIYLPVDDPANEAEVRYIRDNSGTKTTQIEGEHAGGRWHFLTDWRYWLIVLAFTASAGTVT